MAFNDTHRRPRETYLKSGKVIAFPVLAAKKILKGDMVRVSAAGYAYSGDGSASLAQDDMFVGIALETVDNASGGNAAVNVRCLTEGVVNLALTPNVSNNGTLALHATGNAYTVTASAANMCAYDNGNLTTVSALNIGWICGIPKNDATVGGAASTTHHKVKLLALMQIYNR